MTNNHSQARNRLLYVCIMYFFPFTNTNSRNNQIKICHEQMVAMKPLMQYQKQCSAGYLNSPQCANHLLSALYDLQCCYLKLKWKKKNELKLFSYRLFFFKARCISSLSFRIRCKRINLLFNLYNVHALHKS